VFGDVGAGAAMEALRQLSGTGFTLHPTHGTGQQHSVMVDADDFDHAVRPYAVDDDVPRAPYPLILRDQATPQTEWINTDTRDLGHFLGAGPSGGFADDRKHGPHQQVVALGRFDPEFLGASEQYAVDVGFGTGKQPVTQCPAASLAIRARRRTMAASWSVWLSSAVVTVS
jgi:hypothetical protein